MTQSEQLLRLALAMPDAAIPTICRSIAWICLGIDDPDKPMMFLARAELIEAIDGIIHDKALREQFSADVERLKAEYVPGPKPVGNVVAVRRAGVVMTDTQTMREQAGAKLSEQANRFMRRCRSIPPEHRCAILHNRSSENLLS